MRKTGNYETIGDKKYFIPYPLPPANPALELDIKLASLYGEAMLHLGKLNEMALRLPNADHFIKAYVIKEALLSSSIEGINTTMLDVFTQPLLETKPDKSTQLVLNYTKALNSAVDMIRKNEMPVISKLILYTHEVLMQDGNSNPGKYRQQSVNVGNLIPAPAIKVPDLMSQLEQYINTDDSLPPLIKAGLAHVQFETIHPFLDGNGRIGRLLIVLMLVESKLLSEPIIYPSYYFKKYHLEYYQKLDRVRTHGDFEGWITFYLTAIRDSSIDAYLRAKDIEHLNKELTQIIAKENTSPKIEKNRLKTLSILFNTPIISVNELKIQLKMSYNSANQIITDFVSLGFLKEETQQKRGKLFKFNPYFEILKKEY